MEYDIKKTIIYLIIIVGIYNGLTFIENSYGYINSNEESISINREELTRKEEFLFNSMGIYHNYVYKIENIQKDENYKLLCWSEEYKDGKLVNKEEISKFYINENNNLDSTLYVILNIENDSNNTITVSMGTLSDVPNNMVVAKKRDANFMEGVGSSLYKRYINLNEEIALLGFSKANESGRDTSIDLDNFSAIEEGIKENDMVRLIKIKLSND